ncbi:MAG: RNA-directed DNA polymerase [Propionibacteriaceae bacterium]
MRLDQDSQKLSFPDESEVLNHVKRLKSNCASGHDGVSAQIIKHLASTIVPVLTHLIKIIFETGVYPETFKLALATPIHKGGTRSSVENYRLVSVLPTLNKVVEGILHDRLQNYFCAQRNLMFCRQFGFRERSGTETAAIELTGEIRQAMDSKCCVSAVFIDLRKAFDLVDHESLLEVLEKYGVRGNALEPFRNYLKNRRQSVKVGTVISDSKEIDKGVVQGSRLGPLLFTIFINAIGSIKISGKLYLYADDAVVINIHKISDSEDLIMDAMKEDMRKIIAFFQQRKLTLNSSKTQFMIFKSPKVHVHVGQTLAISPNVNISRVSSVKYLGLNLTESLSWARHVDAVRKKLAPTAGVIWKLRNKLPRNALKTIYDTLFQSHINFMSPAWGFCPQKLVSEIQILQNRTLRNVYHIDPLENRVFMYLNLVEGHLPIRGIIALNTATSFHKCITGASYSNVAPAKVRDVAKRVLRNSNDFRPTQARTNYGLHSFESVGPRIYNKIDKSIKNLKNPKAFRWALRCHLRSERFISSCFNKQFFDLKF